MCWKCNMPESWHLKRMLNGIFVVLMLILAFALWNRSPWYSGACVLALLASTAYITKDDPLE